MKEPNANGDGKSLVIMGGNFEFYCLQRKNPVGISKILVLFLVGMSVHFSFPMGMKFLGYFSQRGRISGQFFQWGGVPPGL